MPMSPVFGKMSTKHGYRRVLLISTALVAVGSVAYAVAASTLEVFFSQLFLGTNLIDFPVSSMQRGLFELFFGSDFKAMTVYKHAV